MFCFRLSYKVVFLPFYTVVKDLLLAQSSRPHRKMFYFPMNFLTSSPLFLFFSSPIRLFASLPLCLFASACSHSFLLVGLTGLEPVTLRLSSACSNQLSYRPAQLNLTSFDCSLWDVLYLSREPHKSGGKGIRTPDL